MPVGIQRPGIVKTWIIAVRPFAYTASLIPVLLGLALSCYVGAPLRAVRFAVTLLGVLCFHTAANLFSDCFDFRRGLDTEVRPGSGAIVRGLLSTRQVFAAGLVFLTAGVACGAWLFHVAGWMVLALGAVGTALSVAYASPGVCLKCHGLGDAAIFLAFGALPVLGTFWVQTGQFNWLPVFWSVPVALLTVGILHANNWRDIEADTARGCRTLASLLGPRGSAVYHALLVLGPFAVTLLYLLIGYCGVEAVQPPATVLITLLALPAAWRLLGGRRPDDAPERLRTLDMRTARLHLVFGALLTAAFFLGG